MSVGSAGYSWSSTSSDIYGRFLYASTQELVSSNTGDRAVGRQLRCLSE
ncbi:hypothetical protein [uncultured Rikenella sp.]|nr:hypothetical protein [uncultured Rikenella sp.]